MKSTITSEEIYRVIYTEHYDPHSVLGQHMINRVGKRDVVIRSFLPGAEEAFVIEVGEGRETIAHPMLRIHDDGFFEAIIKNRDEYFPYMLRRISRDGAVETFYDSYSFLPTLTELDIHLFSEGNHHRIFEKLGAHYAEVNGIGGVQFAVWAPSARSVSVIGNFNNWDRRYHAMRVLGSSGIWEIFIPGLNEGELYKFQIKTQQGIVLDKADPYGFEMEVRPRTSSKVNFLRDYTWNDSEWMTRRKSFDISRSPMSVYEVHLGSWMRGDNNEWLPYREMVAQLIDHVKETGFTHVELLPMSEHPFDGSWGYQVTGYFAPTSRFGSPSDFMYFVDQCHQNDIGIILDWVPAHFPKDSFALADFDGTHLYEHEDPRKGEHQDWGTYIFNFGRNEVKNFLISNALFWLEFYHIDGLRIDAVASMLYLDYSRKEGEWIPNEHGGRENLEAVEFLKYLNSVVHEYQPGVLTIAEESTSWPGVSHALSDGGLGFDLKWNMGWMHDTLEYFSQDPVHRSYYHRNLTFSLLYAFSEKFLLCLSHDEVVHGKHSLLDKMPGDVWQKFANLRLLYGLMFAFPGKKLLFMGAEFGQWDEWNHDKSLDWNLLEYDNHLGVFHLLKDLHRLLRTEPALYEIDFEHSGFEWVDFQDSANSIVSFERKGRNREDDVLVVINFTPVPRSSYRIGVQASGGYTELFNSDSAYYGGSNLGNGGIVYSESIAVHGRANSLSLTLPPLAAVFLKRYRA